jgi:hypothetical protein
MISRRAIMLTGAALIMAGCGQTATETPEMVIDTPADALAGVAGKRVLFAHQSVGSNILEGVALLSADNGAALNVVETAAPPEIGAGLYHFYVGENGAPEGKIEHFDRVLTDAKTHSVDVALLKLCYVDITSGSDAERIAAKYISTYDALKTKRPEVQFVAVTCPLTAIRTGPKESLKNMIGRGSPDAVDNERRTRFNELVRAHFPADRLFDLAAAEATATPPSLAAKFTNDGGHLNEIGQRRVAAEFLRAIARA